MPTGGGQKHFKRHGSWSAEDSKAEMSKWVSHKPPTDPAVEAIQKSLEANKDFFMENVACLCDKYKNALGDVLQKNPKAQEALKVPEPSSKPTPLLQRQESTVTSEEHIEAKKESAEAKKNKKGEATVIRLVKADAKKDKEKKENDDDKKSSSKTSSPKETTGTPKMVETESGQKKIIIKKEKPAAAAAGGGGDTTDAAVAAEEDSEEESDGDSDDSSDYDPSPDAPEVVFPNNDEILKQLSTIKREAYELGTTFDGIHDWVALNIPDMKEEDNEGVEVMGAVIEQVTSISGTVRDVYGQQTSYLEDRAELECGIMKYPDSVSLRHQLEVLDNNTWDDLDRNWRALLRSTLILYTTMFKNMPKLKNPRKQRSAMSSYAM